MEQPEAFEARQQILTGLHAGESLLWSGQPPTGLLFRPGDFFMVPFSLFWGGFAFFWEYMAIRGGAPLVFCLFGLPFVLIGLYLIIGRFFIDARMRDTTIYAITSERILVETGLFSRRTISVRLRDVGPVTLTERADGRGTISFASGVPLSGRRSAAAGITFELIEQARNVHQIFESAQSRHRAIS